MNKNMRMMVCIALLTVTFLGMLDCRYTVLAFDHDRMRNIKKERSRSQPQAFAGRSQFRLIPSKGDYTSDVGRFDDSPFGLMIDKHSKNVDLEDVHYLGVKWIRTPIPFLMYKRGGKNFLKRRDNELHIWQRAGLRHFVFINPGSKLPADLTEYSQFVKFTVDHYSDPDSFGALYFVVHNEPNLLYDLTKKKPDILQKRPMLQMFWQDTPENYAILLRKTYETAKKANPRVRISLGSVAFESRRGNRSAGFDFFNKVFNFRFDDGKRGKEFIDFVDIHPYGNYKTFARRVRLFKNFMKSHSLDLPIWCSELGISSVERLNKENTERHAQELIKIYVTGISLGVEKLFWTGFSDYNPLGNYNPANPFQYMGLSYHDGKKKPAYFSYKLMTAMLEGSAWPQTKVIHHDKNGLYLYKFMKKGTRKETFVAWKDNRERAQESEVKIPVSGRKIRLTTSVMSETDVRGNVDNIGDLFPSEIKTVKNGTVQVRVGINPVFIEVIE